MLCRLEGCRDGRSDMSQVSSPALIGRAQELDVLVSALDAARARGGCALVAGDAGVGKSRLIAEVVGRAQVEGFLTLQGHAFERDRAFPYAPLVDLLRTLLAPRQGPEILELLGPLGAEVVKLLPELRPLGLEPSAVLEPEAERRRLCEALVQFVTRRTEAQPLVVVLEDLHWSDEASLDVLHLLARRAKDLPVLVLGSYRSEETSPSLRHLLAQLDRERLARELVLRPLAPGEVDLMLRAILRLDRPAGGALLDSVYALSEGNPFFVEEILRSLIAAGDSISSAGHLPGTTVTELHVPRSVHDSVERRLGQLSTEARRIATVAAVAGRRFAFGLLEALTGWDEGELLERIKELITAQLVVEDSPERFAFRHALMREAIYSSLLSRERTSLHHDLADALEGQDVTDPERRLGDLAYHWFEAGAWQKALHYAVRAAERAESLYAPRAAILHFTRALEVADRLGRPPALPLLLARGLAYRTVGDFEGARSDLQATLEGARAAADRPMEWRALLELGKLWASRDYDEAGSCYRRALSLAQETRDEATIAHSLNRLGNWHLNLEQPLAALGRHREALAIFEGLGDRRGLAETLDLLGMASYLGGDLRGGTDWYERAVALFRELDDRRGLVSSLATMTMRSTTYQTDSVITPGIGLAASAREGEEALALAQSIGWRSGEAYALMLLSFCLGSQGEYGHALEHARTALDIADAIEHRQWMTGARCALGAIHLDMLDHEEAASRLQEALALAREIGSAHWLHKSVGLLASLHVRDGDARRAESLLDAVLSPSDGVQTLVQRLCWCARAEAALALGDPDVALAIAERLLAPSAAKGAPGAALRPLLLRGEALTALSREAEAEEAFAAAADLVQAFGARPMAWRVHLALGRLRTRQRREREAEEAFAAARAIVEELSSTTPEGATLLRRGHAAIPSPPSARERFGGLTRRERQVAALIAQEKTNRAIATALGIGERTAESHVGNIMNKLGINRRQEIGAWARECGLAERAERASRRGAP
jgi:DNA-binding CsgD family transcriptional regulator